MPYARAFVLPEGNQDEPLGQRELYYSFDWGPVHVVALNLAITNPPPLTPFRDYGRWIPSMIPPDNDEDTKGPMRTWANNDLNNSKALWNVAFLHFSPYTYANRRQQGNGIDDDERIRQDFGDFFDHEGQGHKVDLVIAGHEHFYERTNPLRFNAGNIQSPFEVLPDGGESQVPHVYTNPGAPVYIVTGGGGRTLSGVPNPQGGENFRAVNGNQQAAFSEHHLTTFSIENTAEDHRVVIRAIDHTGTVRDTATIVKTRIFRRGDADANAAIELTDAIFVLEFMFLGGARPSCLDAADADDNGAIELTDAIFILEFMFLGGPAPPAPFPNCGTDPTADNLAPCVRQPECP
jgi:hypothetical protein